MYNVILFGGRKKIALWVRFKIDVWLWDCDFSEMPIMLLFKSEKQEKSEAHSLKTDYRRLTLSPAKSCQTADTHPAL